MGRLFSRSKDKAYTESYDALIVGLGNPGGEYENTRHNVGFRTVDMIADKYGASLKKLKFKSYYGACEIDGHRCLLCKPQTFMNLSGQAVQEIMAFYKLPPERTILIYDDVSLPVGKLRIRRNGSDGGHNGVKNIIYLTASDAYPRIKIGVGAKPHPDYNLADWVLSSFKEDEAEAMQAAFKNAVSAVPLLITGEFEKAMNRYNR